MGRMSIKFDPVSQSQISVPTIMRIVKDFIRQYEDKMNTKDKVVRDDIIKNTQYIQMKIKFQRIPKNGTGLY